jgi:hypothetical protein
VFKFLGYAVACAVGVAGALTVALYVVLSEGGKAHQ